MVADRDTIASVLNSSPHSALFCFSYGLHLLANMEAGKPASLADGENLPEQGFIYLVVLLTMTGNFRHNVICFPYVLISVLPVSEIYCVVYT